ncbi:NUDIX hydrolase (macronuclear) [Tetrahymena thermophila SB210]|uniref:NUDIX hydrolase n=1 Tax=Tetrahymena thermophila (strain SB210) TaxID=312017 RepID=Q22BU0_TETTS|nr:NUDIX hydrolase [Tetrahymena thermophila SB210]EAR82760.1 NUDIX hydrolase [Tetrahymena thermophila SB210]|eukprot:XP_001030423.1 NUDIX hydrolase [Tetrahymena thermophila SB210]
MIQTGVLVIILNSKDQILLGRRMDNKLLSLPGGKIEFGESLEACAKREVKEETDLDLEINKIGQVGVVNVNRPQMGFHSVCIIQCYFVTEEESNHIKNTEPHKCYGWQFYDIDALSSQEIQQQLGHAIKEFLLKYYQNDTKKLLNHCKSLLQIN